MERHQPRRPTRPRLPVCPGDAALWRRRPRPPSTVSHELLNSKHKRSSLAGTARSAAFGDKGSHDARAGSRTRPDTNGGPTPWTTSVSHLANLVHRRVDDPSSTGPSARKTRFSSATCTSSGLRCDGSRAPLSCGETSLGSDRTALLVASSEARGDLGPLVVVDVGAEHPGIRKCRAPRSVYVASDREPRKFRMQVSAR